MIAERERRTLEQEFEWERLSYLLTPINNFMRDVKTNPKAFVPTDFFIPSYRKEELEKPEKQKKISLKEVKASLGSKFKK